ncbi:hypothetical protein HMPREF9318_01577 [Streptococcus urinalis FB127-CNA-2]|uniref:Uncharacterized protein n=1 Tax=Streptococcus urinalis 2285-97 TaxID=764291 RepID=G5KFK4_9STRE|nr:hypothetical protein [Streptococcus urinalis]EHJ57366.1 hypothetical protein STRUR_2271 [Streptococcus urinalis 2285-97]EKS19181.1 hypothetical protein HMPREF9318_01577 [Streptococcus urinalis FB127-CNA-2]VEF33097.1 phage membrane protein [Streptococcus urinalis]
MINELNLTPHQYIIVFVVLLLLGVTISNIHSYIEIDIPKHDNHNSNELTNPNYGAYLQSQSKYYN